MKNALVVFEGKNIRKIWHKEEWYFSVIDIIAVLTKSQRPRKYWSDLKLKLKDDEDCELSAKIGQLKLISADGKKYLTDCANVETLFRIIQSVPSPNANKMKLWLARVGYERIQEIENPELAQDRAKQYYELKGYPKDWIDKRLRGIAIRQDLTDEWKQRGIEEKREYAILTNEISEATFGVSIKKHKQIKSLNPKFKNQNLRDHMTDWELILNMIGEKATTDITQNENSQCFKECKSSATKGGNIAKRTRKDIEKHIGKPVVSKDNFLPKDKRKKISNFQ